MPEAPRKIHPGDSRLPEVRMSWLLLTDVIPIAILGACVPAPIRIKAVFMSKHIVKHAHDHAFVIGFGEGDTAPDQNLHFILFAGKGIDIMLNILVRDVIGRESTCVIGFTIRSDIRPRMELAPVSERADLDKGDRTIIGIVPCRNGIDG